MCKQSVGVKTTVIEGCTEYRRILRGTVCLVWIFFLFVTCNSAKKINIKLFREKVNLSSVVPSLISRRTGM